MHDSGTYRVAYEQPQLGLVLTGGGARSAYQVGVLKGIAEILRRGSACPFPIITGTSAGAVSAIALASNAAHYRRSVAAIERVWRDFRVHHVFRADTVSMLKAGMHWLLAFLTGGWLVHPPHAMFDNTPLWDLLREKLDFKGELPEEEYAAILAGAAFLWHPALIDNGSFSLVEAAQLGVPALSSDYPPIREMEQQFDLRIEGCEFRSLQMGLSGAFQFNNAAIAVALFVFWLRETRPQAIPAAVETAVRSGLREARWIRFAQA